MQTSGDSPGLRGRLEAASPFELGQFLLLGNKTGALHLIQNDKRGVLYFLDGQIVSAVGPDLKGGQDAAMSMLAWKSGEFQFLPEPVARSEEIELRTENLLLEAARVLDETGAGKEQLAAVLEQGDELSRTFAALSAASPDHRETSSDTPAEWLAKHVGRELVHVAGHSLRGRELDGRWITLEDEVEPNPAKILDLDELDSQANGWHNLDGHRVYLCRGEDGYRLVHPHPRPALDEHLSDGDSLAEQIANVALVAIYGPAPTENSLLHVLLTLLATKHGLRVVYFSGVPAYDLGNGADCIHHVVVPRRKAGSLRSVVERWQPQLIAIDAPLTGPTMEFADECRRGGTQVLLALSASGVQRAGKQMAHMFGEAHDGLLVRPVMTAPGPVLTIEQQAA